MTMQNQIWALIHSVDKTFAKEDLKTVSRDTLKDLVVQLYDGLKDLARASAA